MKPVGAAFLLLVHSPRDRWDELPETGADREMRAHAELIDDLERAGALVACSPLAHPDEGRTVTVSAAGPQVEPEPRSATTVAGYYVVRCTDLAAAVELAARIPDAVRAPVTVRPLLQLDGLGDRAVPTNTKRG